MEILGSLLFIAVGVLVIAGMWKTYVKAGQPGWGVLIPIYNVYLLIKIAGRPDWWLILLFIPFVNIVIHIILAVEIAKNFGKGTGFAIGLLLLTPIFFMILGFGEAKYQLGAA